MTGITLNLTKSAYDRFFIVGEFHHSYYSFIDLLYQQKFSYKDCLILTGNFLDLKLNTTHILNLISLIKNNTNCYSIMGHDEQNFISLHESNSLPHALSILVNTNMIDLIKTLPSYIFIDREFIITSEFDKGITYSKYFNNFVYNTPYSTEINIGAQFNLGNDKKSDLRCIIYNSVLQESTLIEVPLEGAYYA